ncbi:phosphate regulon sensor protein PhoR [Sporolactobacillus inulinus]|uniref:histidine kinase n=2 Tax=Sporolactobacillus inulinus TaxID=2078 RepID=A0A4Y1ZI25_9BACL|nr:phosphate regulon sensor protein PhoR [Sporolactobacillus inulinus]
MEQILLNLLENAIRYSERGTIVAKLTEDKPNVVISVSDNGIGIPKEELPYIFDRFYRVEKSRAREYGGTGLGLSIVKKYVELQGGTVKVESQLGAGTTFTLLFPCGKGQGEAGRFDEKIDWFFSLMFIVMGLICLLFSANAFGHERFITFGRTFFSVCMWLICPVMISIGLCLWFYYRKRN